MASPRPPRGGDTLIFQIPTELLVLAGATFLLSTLGAGFVAARVTARWLGRLHERCSLLERRMVELEDEPDVTYGDDVHARTFEEVARDPAKATGRDNP